MNVRLHFLFTLRPASLIPQTGGAQELSTDVRQKIGKFLDATARKEIRLSLVGSEMCIRDRFPLKEIRCNCLLT